MNLITTQYVPHLQRLEIYLAGCKRRCKGCHNPSSWDFRAGKEINYDLLVEKCQNSLVENIWILGGEPLDQKVGELMYLLVNLELTSKPIWLFTGYELSKVPEQAKEYLTYIKTGAYKEKFMPVDDLEWNGIKLASTNQKIYKKHLNKWIQVL